MTAACCWQPSMPDEAGLFEDTESGPSCWRIVLSSSLLTNSATDNRTGCHASSIGEAASTPTLVRCCPTKAAICTVACATSQKPSQSYGQRRVGKFLASAEAEYDVTPENAREILDPISPTSLATSSVAAAVAILDEVLRRARRPTSGSKTQPALVWATWPASWAIVTSPRPRPCLARSPRRKTCTAITSTEAVRNPRYLSSTTDVKASSHLRCRQCSTTRPSLLNGTVLRTL